MGINRLTLRKRNFIKPAQMPFTAASGVTYDSGNFQAVLTKALELSDHANFARRKNRAGRNGNCAASRSAAISKSPRPRAANSARSPSSRTGR